MSEPTPTFAGEVQLRRWSESSTQGVQVTFALAESTDLDKFKGLDGKRFMAVLVQIGDDELPVVDHTKASTGAASQQGPNAKKASSSARVGDLCWRAVQWCKEPEFQQWISRAVDFAIDMPVGDEYARLCVVKVCGVSSRKELDTNPEAARKFNQLIRGPYQKHLIARGVVR